MMATSGTLMMGRVRIEPVQPVLSTVNVPPSEILRAEPLAAGARGQVVDGRVEAVEAEVLGFPDDRDDEAVRDRDSDADVDVPAAPVALGRPVGIEVVVPAQAFDAGLGHVGDVAQADALAGLVARVQGIASAHDRGHVDLDRDVRHGDFKEAGHLRGDGLAHGAQLLE